jgi:hypothetical protein
MHANHMRQTEAEHIRQVATEAATRVLNDAAAAEAEYLVTAPARRFPERHHGAFTVIWAGSRTHVPLLLW